MCGGEDVLARVLTLLSTSPSRPEEPPHHAEPEAGALCGSSFDPGAGVGEGVRACGAPSLPFQRARRGGGLGAQSGRRGHCGPGGPGLRLPPAFRAGAPRRDSSYRAPPPGPLPRRPRRRRRAPSSLAAAAASPPNFPGSRRR